MFRTSEASQCMTGLANRIIYPDYELTSVNIQHYDRLFLISGCSLLLSALFLLIEHMRKLFVRKY